MSAPADRGDAPARRAPGRQAGGTPRSGPRDAPESDVVVVGAGIAGLATAHQLARSGRSVRVFEAAQRVGGRMTSGRHDGFLLDEGAPSIAVRGYEATWDLIADVGVPRQDLLALTGSPAMWRGGRAYPHAATRLGLLTGGGLTPAARLAWLRTRLGVRVRRASYHPDRPEATPVGDATIAEWALRRHRDLLNYLLEPVAGGFFGWRMDKSAMAPLLTELSTVGGSRRMAFRGGMEAFPRAVAAGLDVTTGRRVVEVKPYGGRVHVGLADGGAVTARRVVLAVPPPSAIEMHADLGPDERAYLEACRFTAVVRVSLLLRRPLDLPCYRQTHALAIPAVENRWLSGVVFDHGEDPGRVPEGRGLVTLLAGPPVVADLIDEPDATIGRVLTEEAEHYLPGLAAVTTGAVVRRHRLGLPEATPAALRMRREFVRRPNRPIDYAGDWVMARPSCEGAVRSARLAAARVLAAD